MSFLDNFEQYAVIGDPVKHSVSPLLHKIIFTYFKEEHKIYSKLKITPEGLVYNFSLLKSNFVGFNVTSPHKSSIIKYLDHVDDYAQVINSVNMVKIKNGEAIGYNTDAYGFLKGLSGYKDLVKDQEILVLGTGATAKVVVSVLINLGAKVFVVGRDENKSIKLKDTINSIYEDCSLKILNQDKIERDYFGIVNATSVSLFNSNFNVTMSSGLKFVYDVNYSFIGDDFLDSFKKDGVTVIDGIDMLFYQAIKSQEIWRDKIVEESDLLEIYSVFRKAILEE